MNETIEPLNPIAFQLGPIAVHWYGIIIGLGALLGLWLAVREGERRGLHKDTFVDLVLLRFRLLFYVQEHIMSFFNGVITVNILTRLFKYGTAALRFMAD